VVGVDFRPQRHYPCIFIRADVLKLPLDLLSGFQFIWASPPCQRFTPGARMHGTAQGHPDLISPTRALIEASGRPAVIENVPAAPIRADLSLCGAMFGLRVVRHRAFECHRFTVAQPPHQPHAHDYVTVTGHSGGTSRRDGPRGFGRKSDWVEAMGIDWMTRDEMAQAIPPAYSRYIGAQA
jgi:DNA (cytosine-5)-methyltransferase 1